MADITEIGTGAGGGVMGGLLGWLISHLKHREIKEDINTKVHKDNCFEKHKAVDEWRHETNTRFDNLEKKIDDIKDILIQGKT